MDFLSRSYFNSPIFRVVRTIMKQFNHPNPKAEVRELIQAIYDEHDGCCSYRRIRDELMNRGRKVKHKKVYRLMKELGLKCLVCMKKISPLQRDSWENCAEYFISQLPI